MFYLEETNRTCYRNEHLGISFYTSAVSSVHKSDRLWASFLRQPDLFSGHKRLVLLKVSEAFLRAVNLYGWIPVTVLSASQVVCR